MFLKIALIIGALVWFIAPKISTFNDSYEEKFCKSYVQWNKYAWAERNQYSENWASLEQSEFNHLEDLVSKDSPSANNTITKYANQWFNASYSNDTSIGTAYAAMLIVECEKYGVKLDEKYLK